MQNDDNQPNPQRNIELVNIDAPTKINQINTDCLESIFEDLTLGNFLNVFDARKHLENATNFVFAANIGKKAYRFTFSLN